MMSVDRSFPETGMRCLAAVAQYIGVQPDLECLVSGSRIVSEESDIEAVIRLASEIGLLVRAKTVDWADLLAPQHGYPLLARLRNGNWVVVIGSVAGDAEKIAIVDPLEARTAALLLQREQFCSRWDGEVVLVSSTDQVAARAA
jgi:ATP-binding cassette subfamily B protein